MAVDGPISGRSRVDNHTGFSYILTAALTLTLASKRRDWLFVYEQYLFILNRGTEAPFCRA